MDLRGFDFYKKFSVGGWCCGWVHNDFSVLRLSKLVLGLKSCPMVLRKHDRCLKINGCFMDVFKSVSRKIGRCIKQSRGF